MAADLLWQSRESLATKKLFSGDSHQAKGKREGKGLPRQTKGKKPWPIGLQLPDGSGAGLNAECFDCPTTPVACGDTINGELTSEDCQIKDGSFVDVWTLELTETLRVNIQLTSSAVDTFVFLADDSCAIVDTNDDCQAGDFKRSCLLRTLPAGTYFILANSFFKGETGAYELRVECEAATDLCTECEQRPVSCGESIESTFPRTNCRIGKGEHVDIYPFELAAAGPVTFNLTSSEYDTALYLFGSDCEELVSNDDCRGALDSCLENVELEAGSYFVGASSAFQGLGGSFTLEVSCPDVTFCRTCTVGTVECGGSVSGALEKGDCELDDGGLVDLWRLEVADEEMNVTLTLDSTEIDSVLQLLDATCTPVETGEVCASEVPGACLEFMQMPPGVYYAAVGTQSADAGGAYELQVDCAPFVPCEDCAVGPIACGEGVTGELTDGDCMLEDGTFFDVWSFSLDEARQVSIDLSSAELDTFVFLLDADCAGIASNDDCESSPNSCLTIDLPPGEYFVAANSFTPSSGGYDLSVQCAPIETCADCSVGSLTCNQEVTGSLPTSGCLLPDGSALDIYEFNLLSESNVDINLRSGEFDTFLFLFDDSCIFLDANDDCIGSDSCLNLNLAAGTYFVGVNGFDSTAVGNYSLEVQAASCDVCATCSVGSIECGQSVDGMLPGSGCSTEDDLPLDIWEFSLSAEREVTFNLESEGFDPVVSVFGDDCAAIASNDDCNANTLNSCLTVTLGPGTYTVAANSFLREAAGPYRLTMACTGGDGSGGILPGDSTRDGLLDITDGIYLLYTLTSDAPPSLPCGEGDLQQPSNLALTDFNGSGDVDLSDAVALFGFLFLRGPEHVLGAECVSLGGCPEACAP